MAKNKRTRAIAATGLISAMLCVLAPIAIPIGDVPLSLATLVICVSAAVVGSGKAAAAVGVYLILGALGLPVFAGFTAGVGRLLGPTGGFLIGYVPLALASGIAEKKPGFARSLCFMALGTAAMYACGMAWYVLWSDATPMTAFGVCVLPFLPLDVVKLAVAAAVSRRIK